MNRLFLRSRPERITFVAEVLQPDPDRVLRILDQIGRPVVENLDATQLHVRVLNVDPAVGHDVPQRFQLRFVFQVQPVHQQAHGDKIPVGQTGGDLLYVRRNVVHACDQILDRHGAEENVALHVPLAFAVPDAQTDDLAAFRLRPQYLTALDDPAAQLFDLLRGGLPKLARAELGIAELLDEGGLHLLLAALLGHEYLGKHVPENAHDAQFLGALLAPAGVDLPGMAAPELLGVALEEHGV